MTTSRRAQTRPDDHSVVPLTQLEVLELLFELDLLHHEDLVSARLRVFDRSSRNFNLEMRSDRASYFVKQATDLTAVHTVATEAALYRRFGTDDTYSTARQHVPRLVYSDPKRGVLVMEYLGEGQSLADHHRRVGRFSAHRARQLAHVFAECHGSTAMAGSAEPVEDAIGAWAHSLARPSVDVLRDASAANIQLLKIVQTYPELVAALMKLNEEWQPVGLIHGDVKWDNMFISKAQEKAAPQWWLVDWELAGRGDPRWDVGCALAEYLRFWIMTAPITGNTDPADIPRLTRYPLAKLRYAMSAFCAEYVALRHLSDQFLTDVARFTAARLIHVTYEHMQSSLSLSSQAVCMLQLAHNIFQRPRETVFELFGAHGMAWE